MERLPMRKIMDVLRLHSAGRSGRQIAASTGIGRGTVSDYLLRASAAGLSWPLPDAMDEAALEARLFPPQPSPGRAFAEPDWAAIHLELKRVGVTLALLWQEYRASHPDGYGYSAFCEHYRRWSQRLSPVMRQRHVAGERMFVDYSGKRPLVIDPATGEARAVELFVAVMGASNMTYAEASWSQSLPDWIMAHTRAFAAFGAVPLFVVPDNLRSGVSKACFYEPTINRSYTDMANHYGVTILPARPYKPRDKAKVEAAVLLAQRWILARLRNRQFFSLEELNAAISVEVALLNCRVSRHLGGSRADLFASIDRPAMQALPTAPHVYADWLQVTAGADYHVRIKGHYYSVPFQLIGKPMWARLTRSSVEVFHRGARVACHQRAAEGDTGATTLAEHQPPNHRWQTEVTPERLCDRATTVGAATATLIEVILRDGRPERTMRTCIGILALQRHYSDERLEAACERALMINARTLTSVRSILAKRLDGKAVVTAPDEPAIDHANIRGSQFFH